MSNYENLWAEALDGEELEMTTNVAVLLEEQCDNLSKLTDGKIVASFAPIELSPMEALRGFARTMAVAESAIHLEKDDNLKNANKLYSPERYAFDIKTDVYRFRLFELTMRPIYPISITFDEGVYNEAKDKLVSISSSEGTGCRVPVENDDDLMFCVGTAIKTKKVRYILQRLMEEPAGESAEGGKEDNSPRDSS